MRITIHDQQINWDNVARVKVGGNGLTYVHFVDGTLEAVNCSPAEIAAKLRAAAREAKFEDRVHARAEALYSLWIRQDVDDPSHEAAYEEAIRFVAKGQSMIDAHFATPAPSATPVAGEGGEK